MRVCLSYDENAAHWHCTLCATEMFCSFSSVICDLCSIQLTFSLLLFSIRLMFAYAFFLLNYDICVRHLCRFHFSNSFFFCRYFKKKSTLSCQHEHGAFVGFMNIWIFIYIFWLLFHPDLLDHQRICITFHRLHLRVEVSDGEVFLFPKVYIRCALS